MQFWEKFALTTVQIALGFLLPCNFFPNRTRCPCDYLSRLILSLLQDLSKICKGTMFSFLLFTTDCFFSLGDITTNFKGIVIIVVNLQCGGDRTVASIYRFAEVLLIPSLKCQSLFTGRAVARVLSVLLCVGHYTPGIFSDQSTFLSLASIGL